MVNNIASVRSLPSLILLSLSLLMPVQLWSQGAPLTRPRLGLALSGGGAKGIAHIGVIRVMEETGLTPDYITGVSMGSIIGGMYAMGYSSDSIASILRKADWSLILSDRIPENKIIFHEKKHFNNSIIALPVTHEKISLPSGLINGQQVENALGYYCWPAAGISDFSKLPIPFLCVATDIRTGNKVLLRKGYLPDAIRASIAIPTFFTPVRIDSVLLVDGGTVHNYAATELRDMGADIVIGSYVGARRNNNEEPQTVYEIVRQIITFTSIASYEEEKRKTDILIEPDLKGFQTLSFENNVDTIIAIGYREALKYKERFKSIADSLDKIAPREPVKLLPATDYYQFDRVEIKGNNHAINEQVKGILGIAPGDTVTREMIADGMELLYGKAWFEKINYRIISRNDSLILEINYTEKPPTMLYGSLHYDLSLGPGVLLNFSARDLLTPKSVIDFDSFIGKYFRYRLNMIQFIGKSQKFSIEADLAGHETRYPLMSFRGVTGPMTGQNIAAGLSLGKRLGLNDMMNISCVFENQILNTDYYSESTPDRLSYDYLRFSYSYQVNTLNFKHFPDEGITGSFSASASRLLRGTIRDNGRKVTFYKGDDSDFSFDRFFTLRGWVMGYNSPSAKLTLNFGGEALFVTGADSISSNNNLYLLGGIESVTDISVPATGFHENQVPVKALTGIRMGADFEIATNLHLSLAGNLFAIKEPYRNTGVSLLGGYGLGLGYMTVAGPVRVGLMHGIYNREVFYRPVKGYISIGFSF